MNETPILEVIFDTLIEITRETQGPRKDSEAHFHAYYSSKTILVFLPAAEDALWSLISILVSLSSVDTVQARNINSCILQVK